MPKVSVIIPIFNVEKYLKKCLDSVINQTFKDIEIICVNDGSTDNSLKILEEYSKLDNRIKIINKSNGGSSSARNAGLTIANAEYCYFIDSDDWLELNTLEKLYNIMISNDVDSVIHGANNILGDKSYVGTDMDMQDWFESFTKSNGIYDVPTSIRADICSVIWNKLYKMEIINKYNCRFANGLIQEDELFLWTYMIHCRNYYYLNEKLYNYFRHSDSLMGTRNNSHRILDILDIQVELYKLLEQYKNINDYKSYLTQDYFYNTIGLFPIMPQKYRKEAFCKVKDYYNNINHDNTILNLIKYISENFKDDVQ